MTWRPEMGSMWGLAAFAMLATFIGNLLSFNRRGLAAALTAAVSAALFIARTYYPHGLPPPKRLSPG